MRNIVQIDFNDMNNCGVLNSASSESSILLCITPEDRQKTSLKVEITGSNGEVLTSPELMVAGGIIRYEADREYWTEAGTMKVRVLSGEGNSGYAEFQIIEDMGEANAQVKQVNRNETSFEVIANGKEKDEVEFIKINEDVTLIRSGKQRIICLNDAEAKNINEVDGTIGYLEEKDYPSLYIMFPVAYRGQQRGDYFVSIAPEGATYPGRIGLFYGANVRVNASKYIVGNASWYVK